MQDEEVSHFTNVLTILFSIILVVIIIVDLWIRHDSSNLLLHLSLLINLFVLIWLINWFYPRWKYSRICAYALQTIGFGGIIFHRWIVGGRWEIVLPAFICVIGLSSFILEAKRLKTLAKTQKAVFQKMENV